MDIRFEKREHLKEKPDQKHLGFGKYMTDYMFVMDWTKEEGWKDARIVPEGPITMDPACVTLHYAQETFEGMKAYRTAEGKIQLFRPEMNAKRMINSNARLCMPEFPVDMFVEAVKALVKVEEDWVPSEPETSLYIRPFMFATEAALGVHMASAYKFMIICCPVGAYYAEGINPVKILVEDELDVKEVVFKDDIADFISYSFKPQMRTVGPKYGKLLNKIKTTLSELDGNKAMAELKSTGELKLDIDGQEIVLLEEDLLIDMAQMEGYVSESDHTITVVLDTNLTPELIEEGFVRELVSKIQTMRKEAGFEVMDKIRVYAKDNDKIVSIMKNHGDEIKSEVLAEEIVTGETKGYEKEWNINSEKVTMAVERI